MQPSRRTYSEDLLGDAPKIPLILPWSESAGEIQHIDSDLIRSSDNKAMLPSLIRHSSSAVCVRHFHPTCCRIPAHFYMLHSSYLLGICVALHSLWFCAPELRPSGMVCQYRATVLASTPGWRA